MSFPRVAGRPKEHRSGIGRRGQIGGALALCSLGLLCAKGCTYDFDAAFSESPTGLGAGGSATTSSGGATATGGSGAESPTGGTGGGIAGENCTNGVDDDGDGFVDCEDPDCAAFTCAPLPPTNWQGPIGFALVPGSDPLPSCASVWPTSSTAYDEPQPSPVECTECLCGPPQVGCTTPSTRMYLTTACGTTLLIVTPAGTDVCTPFTLTDPARSVRGYAPNVSGTPSCEPSGGEIVPSAPLWGLHAQVCRDAPFGAGCTVTHACVPGPTVSFAVCITRPGDEICPPGYPQKRLLYASYENSRTCSACACSSGGGASCTGETELWFASTNCSGDADLTVANDTGCGQTGPSIWQGSLRTHVIGTANPCNPSGGASQGSVTPTDPITVCCLP